MSGLKGIEAIPVFSPDSPQAQVIKDFSVIVFVICAVIMLIVVVLIVYSLVRFRARPNSPEPSQITGNRVVEITWTVIPLLIITFLFVFTARTMNRSDPLPENQKADLVIIGHQWWWEARYPSGAIAANEIHIPVGQKLLLRLETGDVIHDFWVPQLGRKMDMVPGHPNNIWLEANHPGTFYGTCAEYCGTQHAWMRIAVIAQTPEEFEAWQRHQLEPAPHPETAEAKRGAQLFQQMTCVNCHAIKGTPARAQAAPDLTHLAARQTLATGVLVNNTTNLAQWLGNPQSLKSGTLMPNLHLTQAQIADLVSYLEPQSSAVAEVTR